MSKEPIEIECNDKEIFEAMEALTKRIKDSRKTMRIISHVMKTDVEENFNTEGVNAGEKWEPWSEGWKKQRIKLGRGSGSILTLNGDLRKYIHREATKDNAIVGTNLEYAAIHNFGGPVKKRVAKGKPKGSNGKFDMSKRQFMVFTDTLKAKILTELVYTLHIQDYLDEEKAKLKHLKGE